MDRSFHNAVMHTENARKKARLEDALRTSVKSDRTQSLNSSSSLDKDTLAFPSATTPASSRHGVWSLES